jgi:hypothetical protein
MNFNVSQSYLILFEHLIDWPKQQSQLTVAIQKKKKKMKGLRRVTGNMANVNVYSF